MEELKITSCLEVYANKEELPQEVQQLMQAAFKARDKAYAPYSRFSVGAAIRLQSQEIISGSNQENASYPSGLCAERTAIYYAGANFPGEQIKQMAVSAKSLKRKVVNPIPPCGACRQAMAEYEVKQETPIEVYFMGESGKVIKAHSIKDLLPLSFDHSHL